MFAISFNRIVPSSESFLLICTQRGNSIARLCPGIGVGSKNGTVEECERSFSSFLSACPVRRLVMHGRYWYVHACIREQVVEARRLLPLFRESMFLFLVSSRLLVSHSFSERKFVHEKSGKLNGAIVSTVADERSSKWTISWNPINRSGR